ncbi:hypothetical protein AB2C92_07280 [Pseudomonas aeruginosa]
MQKQTPKWLDLFITAFGAKGLVTLAWWLGALHAERIRSLQNSFPFLEITRGAGSSNLLRVLWKLIGSDGDEAIDVRSVTKLALLRKMTDGTLDWPVVLEEPEEAEPFDWDEIKACYTGDTARISSSRESEDIKFRGALVITGGSGFSVPLSCRMVTVTLKQAQHRSESRQAIEMLLALPSTETETFLITSQLRREQIAERLATTTNGMVEALKEDVGNFLNYRDALNHAQLRALLLALDDLFGIPPAVSQEAHAEVHAMTWNAVVPY